MAKLDELTAHAIEEMAKALARETGKEVNDVHRASAKASVNLYLDILRASKKERNPDALMTKQVKAMYERGIPLDTASYLAEEIKAEPV